MFDVWTNVTLFFSILLSLYGSRGILTPGVVTSAARACSHCKTCTPCNSGIPYFSIVHLDRLTNFILTLLDDLDSCGNLPVRNNSCLDGKFTVDYSCLAAAMATQRFNQTPTHIAPPEYPCPPHSPRGGFTWLRHGICRVEH